MWWCTLWPLMGIVGETIRAFATAPVPQGPAYSVLLVLHVAAAVVGFGALGMTGVQAVRARRGPGQAGADALRRYFRPGVNWAGRVVYAVPLLGFALVADSGGAFDTGDGWVVAGLVLWLVAVVTAEVVVWPGERRIQLVVSERWAEPSARAALDRECTRVAGASAVLVGIFFAAVVIMIGKP